MQKTFSLIQLLNIVDGRLFTDIGSVYEILGHVIDEEGIMTHHLPTAASYLKEKNPEWLKELTAKYETILSECPIKEHNMDQFHWLFKYATDNTFTVSIPQLKDELDTSDLGDYMVKNSLLLKVMNAR